MPSILSAGVTPNWLSRSLIRVGRAVFFSSLAITLVLEGAQAGEPNFNRVSEILKTYCSGCHNESEGEGDFSVASYELIRGYRSDAPLIVEGEPQQSRLIQLIVGEASPKMPPEDQPQPKSEEVEEISNWILQGAKPSTMHEGSSQEPASSVRMLEQFSNSTLGSQGLQTVSSASHFSGNLLALGRYSRVDLWDTESESVVESVKISEGRVTALRLTPSGRILLIGSGRSGVSGRVTLMDVQTRQILRSWEGHLDAIYALAISPDERLLATGSYDRNIIVWDADTGTESRRLVGHHGAITDLDFHSQGELLASTSADSTVKLWHVPTGNRLDTLGQPEAEMRSLRFSADGRMLYAAGADRQIRAWKIMSTQSVAINPLLESRFAHDQGIVRISIVDPQTLVSCSIDGSTKAWSLPGLKPLGTLLPAGGNPVGLFPLGRNRVATVDLKGSPRIVDLPLHTGSTVQSTTLVANDGAGIEGLEAESRKYSDLGQMKEAHKPPGTDFQTPSDSVTKPEIEPNDTFVSAMAIELPCQISGVVSGSAGLTEGADVDIFGFQAVAGESWIFEIQAARSQSGLDSILDIFDANGQPVLQTRLQALRESYFTFRGKDSSTSDDFRLHQWQDMELDEYLYANSEVTRLWLYPRGPDSGFKVYPGSGLRHTYFGTTPVSHALGDPAYIVRPLEKDEVVFPNGLPVFSIFYENDDDSSRERGSDSVLAFRVPETGRYFLRLRDARGFGGDDFHYVLTARQPQPDYKVSLGQTQLAVPRGSGRELSISIKRSDGFQEAVRVELSGLPEGILVTNPLIIEAGQYSALGTIYVPEGLAVTTQPVTVGLSASVIASHGVNATDSQPAVWTKKLEESIQLSIVDLVEPAIGLTSQEDSEEELSELAIRPGQTISAILKVRRRGLEGAIGLGRDDAGRNLPHGAFVDNVGLNGLLITEGNQSREIFITAAPKLKPGRRQFHFRSESAGNPTSKPIWLIVTE